MRRKSGWDALGAIPLRSLLDPASLIQIALAIAGTIAASRFEWLRLRELTMNTAIALGAPLGLNLRAVAPTAIQFNGQTFEFVMVCTWVMAYIGTVPLIWNLGQSLWANLARIVLHGAFIFAMNITRLELCFLALRDGVPWVIGHALITGAFGFVVYLAVIAQIDHPFARFLLRGPADGDTERRISPLAPLAGKLTMLTGQLR